MKLSKYNNYINAGKNLMCIYNAFTDKTLVFVYKNETLLTTDDIPEVLYDKFVQNGFIVNETIDEYLQYIEEARKLEDNDNSYHLIINPTLNCIFKCHYCYETHIESKLDEDILLRLKRFITSLLKNKKNLTISFFGGEPMIYFEDIMKPLIEFAFSQSKIYDVNFNCNMTSNGFLLNETNILWLKEHSFTHAQITLDGDKQRHNNIRYRFKGDNTYDTIVDNIKVLAYNGIGVTLRLNCSKENIHSLSKISHCFSHLPVDVKKMITVDCQAIWQEENKTALTQKMDGVVSAFLNAKITASKPDFRTFCYADRKNSCVVNYNGDVFKCTARDFVKTKRDGYLSNEGNIIWENNSLERRMASKFSNSECKNCRIFPLCHGGCSTYSMENIDYCLHNYSEEEKNEVVKNRILHNSNTYNYEN